MVNHRLVSQNTQDRIRRFFKCSLQEMCRGAVFSFVVAAKSAMLIPFPHLRMKKYQWISIAGTIGMAVGAAFPLAASAQQTTDVSTEPSMAKAVDTVKKTFKRVGTAESGAYDYDDFESSLFDFTAYLEHECFGETTFALTQRRCEREFGPLADLREILMNGTLLDILSSDPRFTRDSQDTNRLSMLIDTVQEDVLRREERGTADDGSLDEQNLSPSELQELRRIQPDPTPLLRDTVLPTQADGSAIRSGMHHRSRMIWSICSDRHGSTMDVRACYQDNLRLLDVDTWSISVQGNVNYEPKRN